MKYISIVSVQTYFSLLVPILNTSLFKFSWIWVESRWSICRLHMDDPEIYRFGCIPGGVQLEYVGECKVHDPNDPHENHLKCKFDEFPDQVMTTDHPHNKDQRKM